MVDGEVIALTGQHAIEVLNPTVLEMIERYPYFLGDGKMYVAGMGCWYARYLNRFKQEAKNRKQSFRRFKAF